MADVTTKPWDGSPGRWPTAASYCASCLINENTGPSSGWTKDDCHLPVREPDGTLNKNALGAAAAALAGGRDGVTVSQELKRAAARKLVPLYRRAGMLPPDSLKQLAGDTSGGMNNAIRQAAGR